jgi:integrase
LNVGMSESGSYKIVFLRGVWNAEWREPNGRRRRASLGTADRQEAMERLQALDAKLQAERKPAVIDVAYAWKGKRDSLGTRAAGSAMDSRGKALLPVLGHLRADLIPEEAIDAYIAKRRADGRNDGTIVGELKQLRASLAWAVNKGLIVRAPYIHTPRQPPPRDLRLTRDQAAGFLAAIELPHLRLFVVICLTTAARKQAVLDLTWDRVDLDHGVLHLHDPDRLQEGKTRPTVPINSTLAKALTEAQKAATIDHVIEWSGHRVGNIKESFRAAAAKAGLPWISPHVLRHSAASWMAESGVPMQEIAQYLGHSDSRITERVYARMSPLYLAGAAKALELPEAKKPVPEGKRITSINDFFRPRTIHATETL